MSFKSILYTNWIECNKSGNWESFFKAEAKVVIDIAQEKGKTPIYRMSIK